MITPQTQRMISQLAEDMAQRFTPPEYIPGCKVLSVADKDQYAAGNGWIEALCGRHNQQRCRWRGQIPSIAIDDYVDVIFYPSYSAFIVAGEGGTSAASLDLAADGSITGATSQAQDFGANGIDTDAIDSSAGSGIAVADDLLLASGSDVYPDGSANGLNARFENLFGNDVPTSATKWQINTFLVDSGNHQLGFEANTTANSDSYTPTGNFSKSVSSAWFYALDHHLFVDSLTGSATLIWSDSTAKIAVEIFGQFSVRSGTTYGAEIRLWGVQSPGASDNYYAIRFVYDNSTYPDWPFRMKLFKGTGVTFSATDGTEVDNVPFDPVQAARYFPYLSAGGRIRLIVQKYNAPINAQNTFDATDASYPASIKTVYIYIPGNYQRAAIDSVRLL